MHTAMKEDTSLTHEQVPPPRHPSNCAETMCDRVNPFGSRIDGKSQNEIMNPFFLLLNACYTTNTALGEAWTFG